MPWWLYAVAGLFVVVGAYAGAYVWLYDDKDVYFDNPYITDKDVFPCYRVPEEVQHMTQVVFYPAWCVERRLERFATA